MRNRRPKKDKRIKYSLFSLLRFFLYLSLTGFVVSCSFLLFFTDKFSIESILIPDETFQKRAVYTALNILFICIALSVIDVIKKKITIETPVKKILDATHRITHGDFSARITPRSTKKMTNEFDIIIEDFNTMAQALSQTETLKTDFIANVSHELKTPLSVIQNYSTLLQAPELTEKERMEYTKALSAASKNLTELITNILRLNKLENQLIVPSKERYNLSEQLCECMIMFENKWEEKNLDILTELDEDLYINADKELLSIVWTNLFSNAIKFNREGGKLFIGLKKEEEKAVVTVTDTGCGMNEKTGKHIFEKFYQGDTSHSTAGNGLGLALVKRVIDITNGEIAVNSKLGEGSSFTVKVPLK